MLHKRKRRPVSTHRTLVLDFTELLTQHFSWLVKRKSLFNASPLDAHRNNQNRKEFYSLQKFYRS